MNDALARLATAGSSRVGALPAPETPAEALVPALEPARDLLLRAGARALESTAGHVPVATVKRPVPCPPETAAACPPGVAALLTQLFEDTAEATPSLLDEALELLAQSDRHLPPHLLPPALARTLRSTREAVRRVLATRGRWLAEHAPGNALAWALEPTLDEAGPAAELSALRRVFDEGTLEARLGVLTAARRAEPATARAWVAEVLATEKPEVRAKLVAALGLGLTDEDRPFLEGALGDRAASVRAAVIDLLVRLPRSAVAERQVSRLLACVRTGGPNGLEVTITDALMADKLWAADALPTKAPDAQGLRQYATSLLIGRVPHDFWAEQFGLPLDAFVATALGAELAGPLLLGYSQAVCHHGVPPETDLRPLARALIDRTGRDGFEAGPSLGGLLALLNTAALAEIACASIGGPAMAAVLDALPAPWPEPVAPSPSAS